MDDDVEALLRSRRDEVGGELLVLRVAHLERVLAAGIAGAPKAGDKAAWAPRLKTGMDALYATSLKGKGAMPPKGGNASLADADVKAAVDYLVGTAK